MPDNEQVNTEAALRTSESTLRKILDLAPMAMSIVNLDGTIEYINKKAEQVFGFQHSDIPTMERWWQQAYPEPKYREETIARWMGKVNKALTEKTEIDGGEYTVTCKDGTLKTCFIFGVIAADKVVVMFDDITERVRAERAIRDSATALRRVLDHAPMAIGMLNPVGKIEYINEKFHNTFGYTLEDIPTLERWTQLASPNEEVRKEQTSRWLASVHRATATGSEIAAGQFETVCKDGTLKTIQVMGSLAGDKVVIMFEDMTERVRAERTLRESETSLKRILDQIPMSIAIQDLSGRLDYINGKFTQTFGYSLRDIPDLDTWTKKAYPDPQYRSKLLAHWTELIRKAAASNNELDGGDYQVTCKDGSVKTVYIFGVLTAGKVVCILDDITRRVETEKELRESESRYRALVETTRTGYVIINKEGRVLDANTEYVRLTGRKDLKEVIGHTVLEWTAGHEIEKNAAAVAKCAGDGSISNFEVDYASPGGAITPVEINATVMTRDGVPQILTLCRDISARRKIEAEIRALNLNLEKRVEERTAELTAANEQLKAQIAQRVEAEQAKDKLQSQLLQAQKLEAVGRLAGGIAHDFNNILVSISGYAEILLDTMPQGAPARGDLSEILLETERGAALTRQLLTFSAKQEPKLETVDLNAVAAGSEKMLKRLIGANMHLEPKLAEDLYKVKADPTQISQVIINLVINSRDAMPDGGKIRLETRNAQLGGEAAAFRLAAKPGSYAELVVSDTGTGMNQETMDHLFEPFYTTKKPGQGTGLGLSTVYGIVSRTGGGIAVESAPGKGTTFRIYLPKAS